MKEPLRYFRNLLRGNRYEHRPVKESVGKDNPPVLVLHGYLGTRGAMYMVERRLLRDGFQVFSFPLGVVNTADIRKSAKRVQQRVGEILERSGAKELDIVAHSMGGLISLYYIKELGGADYVRRLVTLGTPWSGTWTALGGIVTIGLVAPSTWQLLPHNPFLRKLHSTPLPDNVRFCSIRGTKDKISPMKVTHLPGAQDILVPCSHAGLVTQASAYDAIYRCLTEPDEQLH